jgi:hypothetical protein
MSAQTPSLQLWLTEAGIRFTLKDRRVSTDTDAQLRRQYYLRLSPVLRGSQFEIAIEKTEGFSFAQLRETFILWAQSAFEHGREIRVAGVVEAIELQAASRRARSRR